MQAELVFPPTAKRASQAAHVLDFMRTNGSIDRHQADEILEIERLAARIFELSKRHPIRRERIGGGLVKYSLREPTP